ncbi:MAG: dienelactone hydrolase family protein, partial [Chloroflexota bacterium]
MDPQIQALIEAHNSGKITRRDFVRQAAVLLGGAIITGTALANSSAGAAEAAQATPSGTLVATLADNPSAKILTKMIEFDTKGSNFPTAPGYLAYPDGAGPFPAVLIIQEWWGLDNHIKAVTELMARNGYAAVAPDLYRGEVAQEPAEAQKLAMALIMDQAIKDIQGAADYLTAQDFVGPKKAGIVGFCFGGGLAWQMAWNGKDNIGPIVAFYGLGGLDITKV